MVVKTEVDLIVIRMGIVSSWDEDATGKVVVGGDCFGLNRESELTTLNRWAVYLVMCSG